MRLMLVLSNILGIGTRVRPAPEPSYQFLMPDRGGLDTSEAYAIQGGDKTFLAKRLQAKLFEITLRA